MNELSNVDFMKEWCIAIISLLSERYEAKEFFNMQMEKVNMANSGSIHIIYRDIYNMISAEPIQNQNIINDQLYSKFHKKISDIKPLKPKEKKQRNMAEYEFIKDYCIAILEFIASKVPSEFKEGYKVTIDNYKSFYNEGIVKGFKEGYRDCFEMAKALPLNDYQELNDLLIRKFGRGLEDSNYSKLLDRIIRQNKISNDEEYRLVDEKVNELCQTDPESPLIKVLNNFLLTYQEKKKNK